MRWSLDRIKPPWEISRPAIFEMIRESLDDNDSLGMHPPALPDEVRDPRYVSWGAGSRDGVSRQFGVAAAQDDAVGAIVGAVTRLARRSTGHRANRLYELISGTETLEYVDRVLPYLDDAGIDTVRLSEIGRWLATKAPDRSAVKFGIALMGTTRPMDMDVLRTLGAHDEFTLYVAVALLNANAGERALFELARRVHGWGRVQTVERLAGTSDPEIQHWMITEGYRNSIMYEYLAATCATTGHLAEALAVAEVDDDLVRSAGELIAAILVGEPGQPPSEYADLVPTVRSYLAHLTSRTGTLSDRQTVVTIRRFLEDPDDVDIDEEERLDLVALAEEFVGREHFRAEAERGLLDPDHSVYGVALSAAKDLDIDYYDAVYHRINVGLDEHPQWFHLLAATDAPRLESTLALGRRMINFDSIATGPSESIGTGPGFEAHSQLLWFLQDLGRFPGSGWDFVETGLASPSVQNRNRSIRTLQEWPRDSWPEPAEGALRRTIDAEVVPKVRVFAEDVLRGDIPFDESWRRAIVELHDQPELARLAQEMADSEPAERLRARGSWSSLAIWDGAYATEPWGGSHVSVGHSESGFTVTLSGGRDKPIESHDALTSSDALGHAVRLLSRL